MFQKHKNSIKVDAQEPRWELWTHASSHDFIIIGLVLYDRTWWFIKGFLGINRWIGYLYSSVYQ